MSITESKARLDEMIAASGVPLALLTPQAGLELMLRVYTDAPAGQCLTYGWRTVTRYGNDELGFDITLWEQPQSNEPAASGDAVLSLLFKVGPRATTGDFPSRMEWCIAPEQVAAFRSTIEQTPAFQVWGQLPAAGVVLIYENVGESSYALFDCWGVRDPSRPVLSMTEEEWLLSDDAPLMLRWFRQEWPGEDAELDRVLQRYCLACCRRIWRLLLHPTSRAGVEVAERFVNGLATRHELAKAEYLAEGAAFEIEGGSEAERIVRWCDEVAQFSPNEIAAMIQSPDSGDDLSPRGLLTHAAYFADFAISYPGIRPKESIERYRTFLPTALLRQVVGNPFRTGADSHPRLSGTA